MWKGGRFLRSIPRLHRCAPAAGWHGGRLGGDRGRSRLSGGMQERDERGRRGERVGVTGQIAWACPTGGFDRRDRLILRRRLAGGPAVDGNSRCAGRTEFVLCGFLNSGPRNRLGQTSYSWSIRRGNWLGGCTAICRGALARAGWAGGNARRMCGTIFPDAMSRRRWGPILTRGHLVMRSGSGPGAHHSSTGNWRRSPGRGRRVM